MKFNGPLAFINLVCLENKTCRLYVKLNYPKPPGIRPAVSTPLVPGVPRVASPSLPPVARSLLVRILARISIRSPAGIGRELVFGRGSKESGCVDTVGAGLRSRLIMGESCRSIIHGVGSLLESFGILASGVSEFDGDEGRELSASGE